MASVWNSNILSESFEDIWSIFQPSLGANFFWNQIDSFYTGPGVTCGASPVAVTWSPDLPGSALNSQFKPFFQFLAGEGLLKLSSTYFWQSFFQRVLNREKPSSGVSFFTIVDTTPRSFIYKYSELTDPYGRLLVRTDGWINFVEFFSRNSFYFFPGPDLHGVVG
jgi:hypothetical protein